MPDTAKSFAIEERLVRSGFSYEAVELNNGMSFRFRCGAILNVFTTGTTRWQGKQTSTVRAVDQLIAEMNLSSSTGPRAGPVAAKGAVIRPSPMRVDASAQSYGDFLGFGDGNWVPDRA